MILAQSARIANGNYCPFTVATKNEPVSHFANSRYKAARSVPSRLWTPTWTTPSPLTISAVPPWLRRSHAPNHFRTAADDRYLHPGQTDRAAAIASLVAAFAVAALFYRLGSFALECLAFLATWAFFELPAMARAFDQWRKPEFAGAVRPTVLEKFAMAASTQRKRRKAKPKSDSVEVSSTVVGVAFTMPDQVASAGMLERTPIDFQARRFDSRSGAARAPNSRRRSSAQRPSRRLRRKPKSRSDARRKGGAAMPSPTIVLKSILTPAAGSLQTSLSASPACRPTPRTSSSRATGMGLIP